MESVLIDALFRDLHPAMGNIGIMHWHEMKKLKYPNLVLLGTEFDCSLFQERFAIYGIKARGKIVLASDMEHIEDFNIYGTPQEIPSDAKVIVTIQDYPKDIEIYKKIDRVLHDLGISKAYIIHEFSAGFALGSESVLQDEGMIRKAFRLLKDDDSQNCLYQTIKTILKPYGRNMDLLEELYGIRDLQMRDLVEEEKGFFVLDLVEDYVIICNTTEFKRADPFLELAVRHKMFVAYYSNSVSRLRLREYCNAKLGNYSFPILSSVLWNFCGITKLSVMKNSGGTPIEYESHDQMTESVTIDGIRKKMLKQRIGCIVLDMGEDYIKAIDGAMDTIVRDEPIIVVEGFKRVDDLWKTIILLSERFKDYRISLRRYETDNVNEGHMIILESNEKGGKANGK